jgi:hypothetical protein
MTGLRESKTVWKTEHSAETTAQASSVWGLLADADGWPAWNPGLASAHLDGPLQNGTTGSTTQASGRKGHFVVMDVQEAACFVNQAKVPGAVLRFQHQIEALDQSRIRVTLGATLEGPMAQVWGLVFGRAIAGYMPIAVSQLVARAQSVSASAH